MLATFGSEGKLLSSIVGLQLVSENLHGGSLRLGVEEVVAAGAKEGGEGGGEGVGGGRGEVGRVARRRWRRVVAGRHVRWREVLGRGGRLRRHGGEGGWVEGGQRGPLAAVLLQQAGAARVRGGVVVLRTKCQRVAAWGRGRRSRHLWVFSVRVGGLQAGTLVEGSIFFTKQSHLFASF